jgi:hypothetical protein
MASALSHIVFSPKHVGSLYILTYDARKIKDKIGLQSDTIMSTLHEYLRTILIISRNSSENEKCFRQTCRENQNTFCVQYSTPPPKSGASYEIMWEKCSTAEQAT